GPDFTASIARRTAAGQVEIHAKETDIFYIVDGTATFVTGGTMIGGKETRPNQMLGTEITGGQTHQLKKGDFISIPAGIRHCRPRRRNHSRSGAARHAAAAPFELTNVLSGGWRREGHPRSAPQAPLP